MSELPSLEAMIAEAAVEFSREVSQVARTAVKEEDIRIVVERQLAFIEKQAGIRLEGKHEFTVASGRVDSVYDCVVIEYKNPSDPSARIGKDHTSPGTRRVVEQIKKRFKDLQECYRQPMNSLLGIGLDGLRFVFVRFYSGRWQVQTPVSVSAITSRRFLWALFNLGTRGKPFSADYLVQDFGANSTAARECVRVFYAALLSTQEPKVLTFLEQWKVFFSEVCAYDVEKPSKKISVLVEAFQLGSDGIDPTKLLFATHTYYALVMKLLASEVMAFYHRLPTALRRIMEATSPQQMLQEMRELENGGIFRHLNIMNFLEGDLFTWYLSVWSEPIKNAVRTIAELMDQYNPGTLSEEQEGTRDLLKRLYQELVPKSLRHDLGEYYTPDWLAEHMLDLVDYHGNPNKKIIDPACGSGTFLVAALNRILKWYEENREKHGLSESQLWALIRENVVGFDLNPLAVMAARTNYLIAVRNLVGYSGKAELPVYLCDSVLIPKSGETLYTQKGTPIPAGTKMRVLHSSVGDFYIEDQITRKRDYVDRYASVLEESVSFKRTPEEFVKACEDVGLPISHAPIHFELYESMLNLERTNRNRLWARIIKNAFAPLFAGQADFVVGNPPWINWNNLPSGYRANSKELWERYRLWPDYILGASLDFSQLFFYVSIFNYLRPKGKIGFVITQSVFKSFGAKQFRRFLLPDAEGIACKRVADMVQLRPFEGAANRTAVITAVRGNRTQYPVPYIRWVRATKAHINTTDLLEDIWEKTVRTDEYAVPILDTPETSPWLTGTLTRLAILKKATGQNDYRSYMGVHTYGANEIYFLNRLADMGESYLVENDVTAGRRKTRARSFSVERGLIRPFVRGRDVHEGRVRMRQYLIFPYDENGNILTEATLKAEYPRGYEFLLENKQILASRSEYVRRKKKGPWYQLFGIYRETFSAHKVVWREQASTLAPAILARHSEGLVIPDHKLMFIPLQSADETYYVYCLLNASVIRRVVESVAIETQIATKVMDCIRIPRFSPSLELHRRLLALGRLVEQEGIENHQRAVDEATSVIWGISTAEVEELRSS